MRRSLAISLLLACAASSRASAQRAPLPLPSELHVEIHLPGPDAGRHLRASLDIGGGSVWTVEGCVTRGGGCRRTRRVELTPAQRSEYVRLWAELRATPRCEPEGIFPGDRPFRLSSSQGEHRGNVPARVEDLASRNAGPCRAAARMALWIASVLGP